MDDYIEYIASTVAFFMLSLPILMSNLYLIKYVFISKKKDSNIFFLLKIIMFFMVISISIFLLIFMFIGYMLPGVDLSPTIKTFGIVIFITYYFSVMSIALGLSAAGSISGYSPGKIIKEILNNFRDEKIKKERK